MHHTQQQFLTVFAIFFYKMKVKFMLSLNRKKKTIGPAYTPTQLSTR